MSDEGKRLNATEQASAEVARTIIPMLAEQFQTLVSSGFTREEALTLTRDILMYVLTLSKEKSKDLSK